MLIEDTTLLDYSRHPAAADLGVIGDGGGRGFELHSALAVRVEGWTLEQRPEGTVVGLLGQQCRRPRPAPAQETRGEQLSRPRKSQTWAAALKLAGRPPAGSRWIYVADRESDFYEPLRLCQQHGVDFVVRGGHDRRLADERGHLKAVVAHAPVLGQTTVAVRARGGQPARTAIVEVRRVRLTLDSPWRPGGRPARLDELGVVEVREVHAPAGVKEPLHWLLLTSLPCATWAQAQRVVGYYTARWWIEEYHKALKTGAGVETSQLERADRLEPLIAVLSVVAVPSAQCQAAGAEPPRLVRSGYEFWPEMLALLEKKLSLPKGRF